MNNVPRKNLKGFIGDYLVVMIIFLIIPALMTITMKYTSVQINTVLANTINANALAMSQQAASNINIFDWVIPMWVVGASMAVLVYAAFLKSSPIVYGAGFLFMVFEIYLSFYISNVFYTIVTSSVLQGAASSYPNTLFLIDQMPVILGVMTAIYLVVGVTKYRSGGFESVSTGAPQW